MEVLAIYFLFWKNAMYVVYDNTSEYFTEIFDQRSLKPKLHNSLQREERGLSGEGFCNGDGMLRLSNKKLRMGPFQCCSFNQSFYVGLLLLILFLRMGQNIVLTLTNFEVLAIYLFFEIMQWPQAHLNIIILQIQRSSHTMASVS